MLGFRVTIVRYISDDPFPGIVECQLEDAHGRRWSFVEKTAIVSDEDLDSKTVYPREGVIAGEIVHRGPDASGREVIRINTDEPWGVGSVDEVYEFDVLPESLVEW